MTRIANNPPRKEGRWKLLAILYLSIIVVVVSVGTVFAVAQMEGKFADPGGQLNDPFKLSCEQGVLADRLVPISDDGEYNWMFAKGQQVNITLTNLNDTVVTMSWIRWALKGDYGLLDTNQIMNHTIFITYNIQTAGHYQMELVATNHTIVSYLQIYASASRTNTALWNCLNVGDLFRTD